MLGSANAKYFSATADSRQVRVRHNGTTNGQTLTVAQMPSHNHVISLGDSFVGNATYAQQRSFTSKTAEQSLTSVGGSQPHSHGYSFDVNSDTHNHTILIKPPYYTLAFIMKT
jgi:microcystin-dependent protein